MRIKSRIHGPTAVAVSTENGMIKGLHENGILTFKGVPFAAPPTENLRFYPPQPLSNWDGILDCTRNKTSAMQAATILPAILHSEDCLYLDMWLPENALDRKNLPVLVFIHGGGFAKGSPAKPMYDGTHFAKHGVIQINITYRLNVLGFLTFPSPDDPDKIISNCGFLDQIAALQWVQKNIEHFGGDPSKVTVSGESAGAFSISNLIVSPLAKGLFSRAILESGNLLGQQIVSPHANGTIEQALRTSREYMHSLDADTIEDLQRINARKLVKACVFHDDMTHPSAYNFWPVFDGAILPKNPYQSLKNAAINGVDILAGYNTDEGTLFIPPNTTEADYQQLVGNIFGENSEKVLARFPVDSDNTAVMRAQMLIKMGFLMGNDIFAEELTKQGHHAYLYNFDYDVRLLDIVGLGTMHALELSFVFNTIPKVLLKDSELASFSLAVHALWSNFIKTGNPNKKHKTNIIWPEYNLEDRQILILNTPSRASQQEYPEDVAFYNSLLWKP